jgi:dTDP-4-dehydrorhamnose 3,5-epimerase
MRFIETSLPGAFWIEPERREDQRGFFARTFCREEFTAHGLDTLIEQCSISYSPQRGTLRGMHYQVSPFEETKLVRCTRGAIFDVIIDLRPNSPVFKGHFGIELTAENRTMLYIPRGFAHGFLTLADDCEVFYQMSEVFSAGHARGVRWDDPTFGISWPNPVSVISQRDRAYPDFTEVVSQP